MSLAVAALVLVVFGGLFFWAAVRQRDELLRFAQAFQDDPDYDCDPPQFFGQPRVRSRHGSLPARLEASGGQDDEAVWNVGVDGIGLGQRTTLVLEKAGLAKHVRAAVGVAEVNVDGFGDFSVRGGAPDVVRGVLRDAGVAAAIDRLFNESDGLRVALGNDGVLQATLRRKELSPVEARRALQAVRQLGAALHAATHVDAVAPSVSGSGLGSASGASVVVPALVSDEAHEVN